MASLLTILCLLIGTQNEIKSINYLLQFQVADYDFKGNIFFHSKLNHISQITRINNPPKAGQVIGVGTDIGTNLKFFSILGLIFMPKNIIPGNIIRIDSLLKRCKPGEKPEIIGLTPQNATEVMKSVVTLRPEFCDALTKQYHICIDQRSLIGSEHITHSGYSSNAAVVCAIIAAFEDIEGNAIVDTGNCDGVNLLKVSLVQFKRDVATRYELRLMAPKETLVLNLGNLRNQNTWLSRNASMQNILPCRNMHYFVHTILYSSELPKLNPDKMRELCGKVEVLEKNKSTRYIKNHVRITVAIETALLRVVDHIQT